MRCRRPPAASRQTSKSLVIEEPARATREPAPRKSGAGSRQPVFLVLASFYVEGGSFSITRLAGEPAVRRRVPARRAAIPVAGRASGAERNTNAPGRSG